MEISSFLEKFVSQLEETDSNSININTIFKDIPEWSSLTILYIIAMVDEEYGVKIKEADIRNSVTIKDLFDKVKTLIDESK